MCGIAGIVDQRNRVYDDHLRPMAAAFAHRGPDDEGFYNNGHVGLAFRRLSILDITDAGHQPFHSADGRYVIVFNGEIYNFQEVRVDLMKKGRLFRSRTDTEVLLACYQEYGEQCLERLNGMFAFAIYDTTDHSLFCARDHLGIKPFYYLKTPERFIFASEIKAILAVPGVRFTVNLGALHEYFTFQNILSDSTLFGSIKTLMPGHTLSLTKDGSFSIEQFWKPSVRQKPDMGYEDAVRHTRVLFERAVERHLVSDVPVGSMLSGGMDSASIVAVGAKHIPHLMTFTAGFDTALATGLESNFDERRDAEIVARHVRSEHYGMIIQPGDLERILPKLIWHLEDFRLGNSYPNYYIAQLSSKFVKVSLSGAGGDELFAGYPWRYATVMTTTSHEDFHEAYYRYWNRLLSDDERSSFFQDPIWRKMNATSPREAFERVLDGTPYDNPLDSALLFELKTFLHGLLIVEDKVSSAHGLEVRVPFLDRELVDFALSLPASWKLHNGTGKRILREALRPFLPHEIVQKKKQGFSAPEQSWFRKSSLMYINETLLDKAARLHEYIRREEIDRVIREHVSGARNHRLLLWSLLSFEWWLRVFVHQEPIHATHTHITRTD